MLHQVGVGVLGPVFRTYEPTRDRLVAVKVFRLDITPEQAQALADELSVAAEAGLFHPSIVEPIAAGVEGSVAYRAEEYVAAESLDVALRHYAPAPVDKALPVLTQLAGAIDFARTAGIGHGALHPRDVFVTPDEARASGFGVVEALERVGLRAPVRRPYSAPERVAGTAWGMPADVFSLAAIAYELLTGRRPAGTGAAIGALTGIRGLEHADAVQAVLARAMDDEPARRYPTALAFVSAFESASRGERADAAAVPVAAAASDPDGETLPADPDDAVAEMPPSDDVDVRAQPVEAEQEEDAFRADEPEFDDILAERDEDEAHAEWMQAERTREREAEDEARDRLLFDDEAVEDLALEAPAARETERFADEFGAAARDDEFRAGGDDGLSSDVAYAPQPDEPDEPDTQAPLYAAGAADYGRRSLTETRPRAAMLPIAIAFVLALLLGFAAGYAVGRRAEASRVETAGADARDAAIQADAGAEPGAGKAFSEQTVAPPAEPPPVPGEAPPPPGAGAADRPAAASAATGRLVVRSIPSRAAVTVNGEWRGRTPLTVTLPLGRHEVRVVEQGYAVAREEVMLSAGTPTRSLSVRLQRNAAAPRAPERPSAQPTAYTGSIYVDSRPRGARVLLDGKMVGVTPLRIPDVRIGSHVIRLQLQDHRDWTASTRVVAGQEARVTGSLERIR